MNKLLINIKSIFNDSRHALLLFFLLVLGTHFLDFHLYVIIAFGLFLVDWRCVKYKSFLLVLFFIVSVYISWIFLDLRIFYQMELAKQVLLPGMLILLMYLLGLSLKIKKKKHAIVSDKRIFYSLFVFVISYNVLIVWSYFTIPQDNPLSGIGMYVCFPNPYASSNINGGHLISTILAYYLTLMTFLLPLILFYFSKFKKQGFYNLELFTLLALSVFILYLSALMGRRTVVVLFILVFLFIFSIYFFEYKNIKKVFISLSVLVTLFYTVQVYEAYRVGIPETKGIIVTENFIVPIVEYPEARFSIESIPIFSKLAHQGLKDSRFNWWEKSFTIMLAYPFGGGYDEYVAPGIKLTHNVWLDMGKDLGILPFILFFLVTILHIYYLVRIFFSGYIENLLKYQLVVIAMGIFAIMLIEPIFNSDKTFFAYIFFYFGVVSNVYVQLKNKQETSLEEA